MSPSNAHAVNPSETEASQVETKNSGLTRLSINLNQEAADALRAYTSRRGISYTEAVRRAIALLKFVDDQTAAGKDLQVSDGETVQKIVMIT